MVLQLRPACAPSSSRNSKRRRSSWTGAPHSQSWYASISGLAPPADQAQRSRAFAPPESAGDVRSVMLTVFVHFIQHNGAGENQKVICAGQHLGYLHPRMGNLVGRLE